MSQIEIGMYVAQNPDVQQHAANTAAASGFAPGTPEYIEVFQKTAVDHAINFGTAEGRVGAQAVATTSPTENNAQAGTSTSGSQTSNFTAPPPPDPVNLNPVLNRIGTPTVTNPNLFQGQAGIMTGVNTALENQGTLEANQQGISDKIGVAGDVDQFGKPLRPQGGTRPDASTLMGRQDLIATNQAGIRGDTGVIKAGIGQAAIDPTTGLRSQPETLFGGQQGIMSGIGTAGEGQTDLFAGQAGLAEGQTTLSENQVALQEGQTGLGTQIGALGTAAVTDDDGTVTQQPTGLFAGQAGLMSGQTGITQDISGLGRDISGVGDQLSGELSGLGGQLGAFRTAAEQYQRGATTQRGDIQGTQRAGQAALTAQVQGVGQQANRAAEAIAQQRQQQQQPAVQQQAAQFAQSAPRATPNNQQVGPMGPMAADPRDALIQRLLTRNASLMNNRPV